MGRDCWISVQSSHFGSHPEAFLLNASFRQDTPILKLCVEINWEPEEPAAAVAALEGRFVEFCPSLREHQCRGQEEYRILGSGNGRGGHDPAGEPPIEAGLALAHLYEHVMIDAIAFITDTPIVSGATGALKASHKRFDIFVESPDALAARLSVGLATSWVGALLAGGTLNGNGRMALELIRHFYRTQPGALDAGEIARALGRGRVEVGDGLNWLEREGLTRRVSYTMNLSGLAYYGLPSVEINSVATGSDFPWSCGHPV